MSYPKVALKADFESGEGTIGNLEAWRGNGALLRADLLQDWIGLLQKEYAIAADQEFNSGRHADGMIKKLNEVNQ